MATIRFTPEYFAGLTPESFSIVFNMVLDRLDNIEAQLPSAPEPMTFQEAWEALLQDKNVRRRQWDRGQYVANADFRGDGSYMGIRDYIHGRNSQHSPYIYTLEDIQATDWEVVE